MQGMKMSLPAAFKIPLVPLNNYLRSHLTLVPLNNHDRRASRPVQQAQPPQTPPVQYIVPSK